MGIYKVKDRRGRRRYVVSKYWPHGSGRLRMYAPNYRSAQALQTRIESSILDGTWKQLKQELAGGNRTIWTVRSFYERFFEEYCKPRHALLAPLCALVQEPQCHAWEAFP